MKKILCNQIDLLHISYVEKIIENEIITFSENEFIKLLLEKKAEYSNQSQQSSAGTLLNETVQVRIKYDEKLIFINSGYKYFVLRLYTDDGIFLMGSQEYPAEVSYTSDKIYANITFKASKPL